MYFQNTYFGDFFTRNMHYNIAAYVRASEVKIMD